MVILFACVCCGIEYLLAENLTGWLYQNREAGNYLRLYALLIPMLYCDAITDAMTKGLGQQVACVRYNILTSALDVIFLFLLLPRYGMMGYYFSFLLTHLLNFLLSLRRLIKSAGIRIDWTEPLLALLCAGAGIFGGSLLSAPALKVAAFAGIFASLAVLTGIVGMRDIRWLRGLVKARSR